MLMSGFGIIPAVLLAQRIGNPVAKFGLVAALAASAAWTSAALLEWPGFAVVEWVVMLIVIWIATAFWVGKHPRRART